jgi:Uma2 family endonuclease
MIGEIIDGELFTQPRPAVPHAFSASALGVFLGGPFGFGVGGPGGWIILYEPELHFDQDVLVPDLSGWRRSRMPEPPAAPAVTLAPDWVCEVLSPSTERTDRARKMAVYARREVAYLWLLNPLQRTLEVYGLADGRWVLQGTHEGSARVQAAPFEAITLDLAPIWPG